MAFNKRICAPMSETEETYLFEVDSNLAQKYAFNPELGGKWILVVGIGSMDSMWIKSCRLYRQGKFPGIKSIKCSTAKPNPKQSSTRLGVIIFHCGPFTDSSKMLDYGRNIVEKLNYFNKSGFISYKSDIQTAQGTRATGNKTNSMYWIPVPKTWLTNNAGEGDPSKHYNRRSGDSSAAQSVLDKALQVQEAVHAATGGKLAFQLVLNKSHQVFPLSEYAMKRTEPSKLSRIMDFKILDVLGSGGFAIVFRAYLEVDDHEYAIKRIPLPTKKDKQDRVFREVKVLAKLNHPNIVRYYSCWQETHNEAKVRQFDEPWKQKLNDRCLTESFRTPVADTTTHSTNPHTDNSTHKPNHQSETTDDPNTLTNDSSHAGESDSDDDLVAGKEYNVQFSDSSTSTDSMGGKKSVSCDTDTHSSNIQFEVRKNSCMTTKREEPFKSITEYLYIQMELCERHTLKDWLVENTERPKPTVLKYFLDIVNAVEHIHDRKMMHRDLKPSNVFFDLDNEFEVKVGDFGLGTIVTEEDVNVATDIVSPGAWSDQHTKNVGTFSYMSPEQRGRGKGAYTYKVDIFSMGLILFEMLWVMRTAQEKSRALQNVREMVFPVEFAEQHPEELALLQLMLHQDPNQRPTTRGIRVQPLLQSLQLPHSVNGIEPEEHFDLAFKRVPSMDGAGEDD